MANVSYIDSDEEIISVIGRLRKVRESEIFLVIPKRAVFLQSLVNLRLLDREAKKLKKELCLVTPDTSAQALAGKAGIAWKEALEEMNASGKIAPESTLPARLSETEVLSQKESLSQQPAESTEDTVKPLSAESIGSSEFFQKKDVSMNPLKPRVPEEAGSSAVSSRHMESIRAATDAPLSGPTHTLPVRDRTPKRLTALNSLETAATPVRSVSALRFDTDPSEPVFREGPVKSSAPVSASQSDNPHVSFVLPDKAASAAPPDEAPSFPEASPEPTPLARFYRQHDPSASVSRQKDGLLKKEGASLPSGKKRFPHILFWFSLASVGVALLVAAFLFLPKADITVTVKSRLEFSDVEISARADRSDVSLSEKVIPLRVVEGEKEVSLSFPATGVSGTSEKRSRGMVVIANTFGESAQTLVATTRLETPDGKIFRLTKGVSVPGVKTEGGKRVPGTVSAEVVADQPGEAFNIAPSSFRFPGLQGSSKYDTITATSQEVFTGGGSGNASSASVSPDDVSRAKEEAEKKMASLLRAEISKDFSPEDRLLDDAIEWKALSSSAFPGVHAVAPSFDYRIRVSMRALVFSERDAKIVAAKFFDRVEPKDVTLEYTIPRADFSASSLLVKARARVSHEPSFDEAMLKKKLLGKKISDQQSIFSEYPEIQKLEVSWWPQFLSARIPTISSRVQIRIERSPETTPSEDAR